MYRPPRFRIGVLATGRAQCLSARALNEPPSLRRRLLTMKLRLPDFAVSRDRHGLCKPRERAGSRGEGQQEHKTEPALRDIGQISNRHGDEGCRCHL